MGMTTISLCTWSTIPLLSSGYIMGSQTGYIHIISYPNPIGIILLLTYGWIGHTSIAFLSGMDLGNPAGPQLLGLGPWVPGPYPSWLNICA